MKDSSVKLSQCMIVKNEEKNIAKALSWGKDVVCEQIVVDTGSADRTVEIAEAMGAKVLHFTWIDDFSAAKNYAIEQASGNWIAFLDADEYFPEEDCRKLAELLERLHPDEQNGVLRTTMVSINDKGEVVGTNTHDRVFRNIPELRYVGRIHEVLKNISAKFIKWCDAQEELMIIHTGYGQRETSPRKAQRNVDMLKKDLKDDPENYMTYMYLGDSYSILNQFEEAKENYRKVLWGFDPGAVHRMILCQAGARLMRILLREPPGDTEKEIEKIIETVRRYGSAIHPELDYLKGSWYLNAGRIEAAADCFESTLEKLAHYDAEVTINLWDNMALVNNVIAVAAFNRRDFPKCVKFAIAALRGDKYLQDAVRILLASFYNEWRRDKSVEPYWKTLCELYDRENVKDMLFLYKTAMETGFRQLMERIGEELPPEIRERLRQNKQ